MEHLTLDECADEAIRLLRTPTMRKTVERNPFLDFFLGQKTELVVEPFRQTCADLIEQLQKELKAARQ